MKATKPEKRLNEIASSVELEVDRMIELEHFLEIAKAAYIEAGCPPCGRNSLIFKFRDPVIQPQHMTGLLRSREISHASMAELTGAETSRS